MVGTEDGERKKRGGRERGEDVTVSPTTPAAGCRGEAKNSAHGSIPIPGKIIDSARPDRHRHRPPPRTSAHTSYQHTSGLAIAMPSHISFPLVFGFLGGTRQKLGTVTVKTDRHCPVLVGCVCAHYSVFSFFLVVSLVSFLMGLVSSLSCCAPSCLALMYR